MKQRPNKLVDRLIATQTARARKDIKAWRGALQQAENVENPKRNLLYNLYNELILDAHLYANLQRRIANIKGCDYALKSHQNNEVNSDATMQIKTPWFYNFLNLAMESLFFGHSLIQIGDLNENGEIADLVLVKRKHVRPELGLFVFGENDDKGIYYREDESIYNWLIEVGEPTNLGLLNHCTPHILYKRFAQAAWSEYCEIFGMPLRYGKTNVKDLESLNRMEDMMINMGLAAYAVIDNDEEIHFVESSGGKGEVYDGLINKSNGEISKLINGAVIGEDSQGGSRSKEEVGERLGDDITESDKQFIEHFVNFNLLPKLIKIGYKFEGLYFEFEKSKDIGKLWTITSGLLQYKDVENDFITETFGIPVKDKPTPSLPQNNDLKADDVFF